MGSVALAEGKAEVRRGIAILRYFAGEALQPAGSIYPSVNYETLLYSAVDFYTDTKTVYLDMPGH